MEDASTTNRFVWMIGQQPFHQNSPRCILTGELKSVIVSSFACSSLKDTRQHKTVRRHAMLFGARVEKRSDHKERQIRNCFWKPTNTKAQTVSVCRGIWCITTHLRAQTDPRYCSMTNNSCSCILRRIEKNLPLHTNRKDTKVKNCLILVKMG